MYANISNPSGDGANDTFKIEFSYHILRMNNFENWLKKHTSVAVRDD